MKSSSKTIILVFNSLEIGGIENKIVDICNHLSLKNRVVLLLKNRSGPYLARLNSSTQIESPVFFQNKFLKNIFFPLWITINFKRYSPNTIISFGNFSSICTLIAKFLYTHHTPIVISEDSSFSTQLSSDSFSLIRQILVKLLYPQSTSIIVQSDIIQNRIIQFIPQLKSKIIVLPNWLPLEHNLPQINRNKTIDFIFIARFENQKNPLLFIDIVNEYQQQYHHPINAVMLGSGSLLPAINQKIKTLKLQKNIKVITKNYDKFDLFQKSKFFILTSLHEGFPLTILEATYYQATPICHNIPEINHYLKKFKNNLIFLNVSQAVKKIHYLQAHPLKQNKINLYLHQKTAQNQTKNFLKTINYIEKIKN